MSIPITMNVESLTEEELQLRFEEALEKVNKQKKDLQRIDGKRSSLLFGERN